MFPFQKTSGIFPLRLQGKRSEASDSLQNKIKHGLSKKKSKEKTSREKKSKAKEIHKVICIFYKSSQIIQKFLQSQGALMHLKHFGKFP